MDDERLLVRVDEAARLLGLGKSKLYEMLAGGELPVVRIGPRARRVPLAALRQWVEDRMAEPTTGRRSEAAGKRGS